MSLSKYAKYDVINGKFSCQGCNKDAFSARFYPTALDITWKCKYCDTISTVNIFKEKGY